MDFKGQQLSEQIFYYVVIFFGVIGWIHGYIEGSFYWTVLWWAGGVVLSIILSVPDWPLFNRHPVEWLPSIPEREEQKIRKSKMDENKKEKKK